MYVSVSKVKALSDYRLEITFENGEVRIFDVTPYLDTGVFGTLRDERCFRRARVSFDTVGWPGGIDLDPEVLFEKGVASTAMMSVAEEGVPYLAGMT